MEPYYTLDQAVRKFFPVGQVAKSCLRGAIKKGELKAVKPGAAFLVKESWLNEWLEQCHVNVNRPVSFSRSANPTNAMSGTSETERIERAQAASNRILKAHRRD